MATVDDAGSEVTSSVAFPSSLNSTHDRTSIYSVHSAQSGNSGSQSYQPRTSTTSTSAQGQPPVPRPPYLPFRRISLPSLPTGISPALLQQQKQQQRDSIASFDSLPEEGSGTGSGSEGIGIAVAPKNHQAFGGKGKAGRPISVGGLSNVNRRIGPRRGAMSMHANSKLPALPKPSTLTLKDIPLDDPLLVMRRKVIKEFYETEKAYVDGLDLIYEHFLLPLLNSLTSDPNPLLDRATLTAVFSNFIDIWNLHKAFSGELTALFYPSSKEGVDIKDTGTSAPRADSPTLQNVGLEGREFPLNPPLLSPILVAHFPYLSLYTPFITSFPATISALNTLITPPPRWASSSSSSPSKSTPKSKYKSNGNDSSAGPSSGAKQFSYDKRFAEWVAKQEKDPRCGRLKLRDWMLTIVQRCPRYLLLLKDLIEYTPGTDDEAEADGKGSEGDSKDADVFRDGREKGNKWNREATKEEEKERKQLQNVHGLVSKITLSLNTSLQMHSQTLSLLALQRATPNLPFQLIEPGRTLLRRGPLIQVERSSPPREREFLLFSDCLVWLVGEEAERREKEWGLNLADFDLDGGIEAAKEGLSALWSSFGLSSPMNSNTSLGVEKDTDNHKSDVVPTPDRGQGSPASAVPLKMRRPAMRRTRSRSDGEVGALQVQSQPQLLAASSNTESTALGYDVQPDLDVEEDVFESRSQVKLEDPNTSTLIRTKLTPTHKTHFSRINKGSHLHLHLSKSKAALKKYTLSAGSSPSHPRHHSVSASPHARLKARSSAQLSPAASPRKNTVGGEERWVFKGRIELVDMEVVVPPDVGIETGDDEEQGEGEKRSSWRWEILSPDGSFVLYATSAREREEWTSLIRQAKSQMLVSLNAQNPNSTLTSSAATQHLRRSLLALPFRPGDARMLVDSDSDDEGEEEDESKYRYSVASVDSGNGESVENVSGDAHITGPGKDRGKKSSLKETKNPSKKQKKLKPSVERRSRVEHWVPAIWIPDDRAEGCMRCGKAFGWRRRRHHCRLCGRCVCAGCSERTFFISDSNAKDPLASSTSARACNECYETVFPLIQSPEEVQDEVETEADDSTVRARPRLQHPLSDPTPASSSAALLGGMGGNDHDLSTALRTDTITSLTDLPSWMSASVSSLPLASSPSAVNVSRTKVIGRNSKGKDRELSGPEVLMAIDKRRYSFGKEKDDKRRSSVHSGYSGGKERLSRDSGVVFDLEESGDEYNYGYGAGADEEQNATLGRDERNVKEMERGSRVKLRSPPSRPRSYHQILEDFDSAGITANDTSGYITEQQIPQSRFDISSPLEEMIEFEETVESDVEDEGQEGGEESSALSISPVTRSSKHHTLHSQDSSASSSVSLSASPLPRQSLVHRKGPLSGIIFSERKEDTVRRQKRFSLPAVGLHTTSVVTRTQSIAFGLDAGQETTEDDVELSGDGRNVREGLSGLGDGRGNGASKLSPGRAGGSHLPGMPYTRPKRLSSVLGARYGNVHKHQGSSSIVSHTHVRDELVGEREDEVGHVEEDVRRGVAADKLSELLRKSR